MRRRHLLTILGLLFGGALLLLAVGLSGFYVAVQRAPEFYQEALEADPVEQKKASDAMLQQATALASDVKAEGAWQGLFTEAQINGWLAVDLVENHPALLPRGVTDPRVDITPEQLTVACRVRRGQIDSIVSLVVDAYLVETNVMALRVRRARAGLLPLPLPRILEEIADNARRLDLAVRWQDVDGDPVALLSLHPPRDENDNRVVIEAIHLGDGEIYLAGRTLPVEDGAASGSGEKMNVQR